MFSVHSAGSGTLKPHTVIAADSTAGFLVVYQIEKIEFKDWGKVTLGIHHSVNNTTVGAVVTAANVELNAHTLAATPDRQVTVGDFGDVVGPRSTEP